VAKKLETKIVANFYNMEPIIDPETGETSKSWTAFIKALAEGQARTDYELGRKIRAERRGWDGVVMLGKVYDTIEEFHEHYELKQSHQSRSNLKA
jgi:hypothetical protein